MALYETSLIFRRLKKSAGKATFSKWRGMDVMKEKIVENESSTPAQQRQRRIFTELMDWCGIFGEAAALGFPTRARVQTPENAFAQANAGVVTMDEEGEVVVDYSRIVCSKGTLVAPEVTMTVGDEKESLTFLHVADENGYHKYATDCLYAVILEKERKEVQVHELNERKDATPVTVMLKEGWDTENLCVYVFYLRQDGKRASATRYVKIA
ncbi:DUF6266 family protein [Odoribacter lunatus]|uniref:DUF6266 family protein n=1 Tax=Odoribacter lunatus TaxID=2941335 RepID=UPI0020416AB3|nr:DUF6266 family protein [Odoribacter lunatus]